MVELPSIKLGFLIKQVYEDIIFFPGAEIRIEFRLRLFSFHEYFSVNI
jgi:hypothetical protein